MRKLSFKQLKEVLQWAKAQQDRKGRTLLERAREYLLQHPNADKYQTTLTYTVEGGALFVDWDCTCPDTKRHKEGQVSACKHAVALLLLQHRDMLERDKRWADFWKEYDRVKAEKEKANTDIPEEFGWF